MVDIVDIGVLSIQGAVSEHIDILNKLFLNENIDGKTTLVRKKKQINQIDSLIIPGGESTTISKILINSDLYNAILKKVKDDFFPIMGTCAGCVILAKKIVDNKGEIISLNLMDMEVERNIFGRQKESFEKNIIVKDLSDPFHAVFIRAPAIKNVWGSCEVLAKIDDKIVAVSQNGFLAYSFHPELTDDHRLHKNFLDLII